ncbi:DUF177 domain-containing protein [Chloroflexota bacterium]
MNVSQQLKEDIGSVRSLKVDKVLPDTAGEGEGSLIQGEVQLTRTNRGILVKGVLKDRVKVTCSRCLSFGICPLVLKIDDEYFPVTNIDNGAPMPLPNEPGYFTIDKHHILDLTEAIRQYELLSLPMKPLCRKDCAGLCPACGHNLNQGPCQCPSPKTDPRWAKLKELVSARSLPVNKQEETK